MRAGLVGRLVVYGSLLLGGAAAGGWSWWNSVPQQVARALRGVAHPDAIVASGAWQDLGQLYFTKWGAVEPILAAAGDEQPISFLVERSPDAPTDAAPRRFEAHGRPRWYAADSVYCRTVGDAVRALLYAETDASGKPRWKRDYAWDWDAWWAANSGYYGV